MAVIAEGLQQPTSSVSLNTKRTAITCAQGNEAYSLSEMHETPPFRRFVFVDRE
jgi:hypothetical protein